MKRECGSWAASLVLVLAACLVAGCNDGPSAARGESGDEGFVAGAFPPTLSNAEYHQHAWSRTDCLKCHEAGLQDAPEVKHTSLTELAASGKCRTCHVTDAASQP